jgi:hypothetical protein
MCFVITQPELLTSGVLSAADESALTAAQFATHAQIYQGRVPKLWLFTNCSPPHWQSLPVRMLPASRC